jgi:hypothetical protein
LPGPYYLLGTPITGEDYAHAVAPAESGPLAEQP